MSVRMIYCGESLRLIAQTEPERPDHGATASLNLSRDVVLESVVK